MYETLILIKAPCKFDLNEMNDLIAEVVMGTDSAIERGERSLTIRRGNAYIKIVLHDAPSVIEESKEISQYYGLDCAECMERFEMSGDDPDMEMFNDYLLVNKRLQKTGKVIIFDPGSGKEFGA